MNAHSNLCLNLVINLNGRAEKCQYLGRSYKIEGKRFSCIFFLADSTCFRGSVCG